MSEFAAEASLPPELNVPLVERYTDGAGIADDLVQGIRFDIIHGRPSFRIGAGRDERADVIVEVVAAGKMRVVGDPLRLGEWLDAVHDPIIDRTI